MIISHKHKFIFSKPRKVAGSSIQLALAKHCGPDDIITPLLLKKDVDAEGDIQNDYARNDKGWFNHMKPYRTIKKLGRDHWDEYFTFSIVRNPWDMLVSRYFWNKKGGAPTASISDVLKEIGQEPLNIDKYGKLVSTLRRDIMGKKVSADDTFEDFMKNLPTNVKNTAYYFDSRGNEWQDFVIRFEHLDEDYKSVCEKVGIPYEPLPQLKTKTRKSRDYREFYTPELRDWVAREFAQEIEHFGYTFE